MTADHILPWRALDCDALSTAASILVWILLHCASTLRPSLYTALQASEAMVVGNTNQIWSHNHILRAPSFTNLITKLNNVVDMLREFSSLIVYSLPWLGEQQLICKQNFTQTVTLILKSTHHRLLNSKSGSCRWDHDLPNLYTWAHFLVLSHLVKTDTGKIPSH